MPLTDLLVLPLWPYLTHFIVLLWDILYFKLWLYSTHHCTLDSLLRWSLLAMSKMKHSYIIVYKAILSKLQMKIWIWQKGVYFIDSWKDQLSKLNLTSLVSQIMFKENLNEVLKFIFMHTFCVHLTLLLLLVENVIWMLLCGGIKACNLFLQDVCEIKIFFIFWLSNSNRDRDREAASLCKTWDPDG